MYRADLAMWSLLILMPMLAVPSHAQERSFTIASDTFLRDGQALQVISGEFHYARCRPELWRDRLMRLRAMGVNAVATYVPWNYHELAKGHFNFAGDRNLTEFLSIAQDIGLMVLLRSGPYMCGEWEFGGFPSRLLSKEGLQLRTYNDAYISEVDLYWKRTLLPMVKPMLYANGGPIIMVQLENEFGSYGDVSQNPSDLRYMQYLVASAREVLGENVVLYTTDGGNLGYMMRGSLNGSEVYTVGDHGPSDDSENCAAMQKMNPKGKCPCMDSEFYPGWLTHWGDKNMANTSSLNAAKWADNLLQHGGSLNLYMGYGGTSFGFWAGANGGGKVFQPDITSYDYDSPLSEGGEHGFGPDGDKFLAFRSVFQKYNHPLPAEPPLLTRIGYGMVNLTQSVRLFDAIGDITTRVSNVSQESFIEQLDQTFGLALYRTTAPASDNATLAFLDYPRDRAQVFLDGRLQGSIWRPETKPLTLGKTSGDETLDVLIEIMGRLNFGKSMWDPKGIGSGVAVDGWNMSAWTVYSMPLSYDQVSRLHFRPSDTQASHNDTFSPTFFRGIFTIGTVADTYLNSRGWGKGMVWINGFNIGRFWEAMGPQHALYVPAPLLQKGSNEIIVLEMDSPPALTSVLFSDKPDFGKGSQAPSYLSGTQLEVII